LMGVSVNGLYLPTAMMDGVELVVARWCVDVD